MRIPLLLLLMTFTLRAPAQPVSDTAAKEPAQASLWISNDSPEVRVNLLQSECATGYLALIAKKDLTITAIGYSDPSMQATVYGRDPATPPFTLKSGARETLFFSTFPKAAHYRETDTITLFLKEGEIRKIFVHTLAYHFNAQTVEQLRSLTLSQSKDRYLLAPSVGYDTNVTIYNDQGVRANYYADSTITRIDLQQFQPGRYHLYVGSDYAGGEFELYLLP